MRNLNLLFPSLLLLAVGACAQSLPTATLTASDAATNPGGLGDSVAISGSTVAAGAPFAENGIGSGGVVYVFTKPATAAWTDMTESARLVASGGGSLVAMSGDASVIVTYGGNSVLVFLRSSAGWTGTIMPAATLTLGPPPAPWIDQGQFNGLAMNATGTTIVAGAPNAGYKAHFHDEQYVPAVPGLGAVYLWLEPAQGWASADGMNESATLTASDGLSGDALGGEVGVSANTVVATAGGVLSNRGAIYLFQKPLTGWLKRASKFNAKFSASDGRVGDVLGASLAVGNSGALVAAGTIRGCPGSASAPTYVFARPFKGWPKAMTQSAELTPSGFSAGCFGEGLAVAKDLVVVGAPQNPPQLRGGYASGADYTFAKPAKGWTNMKRPASMVGASDFGEFGTSNSIGGSSSAVGAPTTTVSGNLAAGAVYVFTN